MIKCERRRASARLPPTKPLTQSYLASACCSHVAYQAVRSPAWTGCLIVPSPCSLRRCCHHTFLRRCLQGCDASLQHRRAMPEQGLLRQRRLVRVRARLTAERVASGTVMPSCPSPPTRGPALRRVSAPAALAAAGKGSAALVPTTAAPAVSPTAMLRATTKQRRTTPSRCWRELRPTVARTNTAVLPGRPCYNGACCGKSGFCGYGPTYCGEGCSSHCDAHAECGQYSESGGENLVLCRFSELPPVRTVSGLTDDDRNVCCSQFGFCGTTEVRSKIYDQIRSITMHPRCTCNACPSSSFLPVSQLR